MEIGGLSTIHETIDMNDKKLDLVAKAIHVPKIKISGTNEEIEESK